jgi:hypothetical protein
VHWPWLVLPVAGPIRISTVAAGMLLVALIVWRRRDPLLALVALLAWVSAYEILYQATGVVMHGWGFTLFAWMTAAVAGWVLLAWVLGLVPNRWLLAGMLCIWIVWVASSFNSNSPIAPGSAGHPAGFSAWDELLNEASKTLLAAAYLVDALRPSARSPVHRLLLSSRLRRLSGRA